MNLPATTNVSRVGKRIRIDVLISRKTNTLKKKWVNIKQSFIKKNIYSVIFFFLKILVKNFQYIRLHFLKFKH